MDKRDKIRFGAFTLAVLFALCGLWFKSLRMLDTAETTLEYTYRRALNDFNDHVYEMCSTLQKTPYVGTATMQNTISSKLLEQSSGAKAAMAILPLSQEKAEKISRFLSQVGDYALSLATRSAVGKKQTEDDFETLSTLLEYAKKLSNALQEIQSRLSAERLSLTQISDRLNNIETMDEFPAFDDNFDSAAKEFAEFPALLYDGPFSEHIYQKEPLFLIDKHEISKEDAAEIAADFLSCQIEELSFTGEGGKQLAVYSFTNGNSHVNITKLGGAVAYFKKSAVIPESKLDYTDALKSAEKILNEMGIENFVESYYVINDNMCTISFTGTATLFNSEIICYPELIKVTVELKDGGTVEYDSSAYLMNKHNREISAPAITAEQAAESLSERLSVSSQRLAIVPNYALDEVLCYEFLCTAQTGEEFIVYVNAETALEEQIYILQKNDKGVLVI